jgi:uncharacterized protein (DUF1800 family)
MFKPLPLREWNYETAAHLLNRAGFGGTPDEIESLRKVGLASSVRRFVDETGDAANVPAPAWAKPENIFEKRKAFRAARQGDNPEAREMLRQFRQTQNEDLLDLRHWWLERMATTPAPLVEKMTLFWHGHFATSAEKVKSAYWLWLQNDTFRRHALGNFIVLTKALSRDPAMMIYLDLPQSKPEHPNENWARELMELFTVGIGNYTEEDIRESARAFTGYRLNLVNQAFRFAPLQHDNGIKKFMGNAGPFNGDNIIDILSRQRACAQFIAQKLWRFFAEDQPSSQTVDALAALIREQNFEMRPVLREMFSSAQFYSRDAQQSQIKSPVQFIVQSAKLFGGELPAPFVAQSAMRQMGQILFAPPNVKGWDGGKTWITASTLLFRYNFANYLINGDGMLRFSQPERKKVGDRAMKFGGRVGAVPPRNPIDPSKIIPPDLRDKPDALVHSLEIRLFGAPAPEKEHTAFVQFLEQRRPDFGDQTMREMLHLMTSTPQFQLA